MFPDSVNCSLNGRGTAVHPFQSPIWALEMLYGTRPATFRHQFPKAMTPCPG